ncbi:response regulator transcription factor [Ramlibacter sp. WS9]|uniref:response regulator transcription factor n=1 Tax=Ramlibacter sp. WS9 TaxID=1882741 RepID=UPI001142AEA2|nr:response regulator transcription factor [Ramlibacter sp. WS9]ROZ75272.1 DNA-binding response regulator [Ramlibacter sp. WS9]
MISSLPSRAGYTVSLVEDEPVLREEMAFQLRHLGFKVEPFESAAQFYRHLAVAPSTIAVLDIGLPAEDGLAICRHLREHDNQMGIVFVTAHGLRKDRLCGLSAGADAYLTKPVDMEELVLILERLALRCASRPDATSVPLSEKRAGAWWLDLGSALLVAPNDVRFRVTANESIFLQKLMHKAGVTCTHVELAAAIGIYPDDLDKHRVEVIISRLRGKVERAAGAPLPVRAVRGVGYCWSETAVEHVAR